MMYCKRKRPFARYLLVLFAVAFSVSSVRGAVVSFDDGSHAVSARTAGQSVWQQVGVQRSTEAYSVSAEARGAVARSDIIQHSGERYGQLLLEFSHARGADAAGTTYARGIQRLRANVDTSYRLSGFYALAGQGVTRFNVYLYDLQQGRFLLRQERVGHRAAPLRLAAGLGVQGVLTAGGHYAFWYHVQTAAGPGAGAAVAQGALRLEFGERLLAVAEPSVLALWGLGMLLLLRRGREAGVRRIVAE